MWGLDFPHFTPKYKLTILEVIDNCGGDKIFKLGTNGVIRKFHSRRKRHIRFACEFAFEWNYKISNVDFVPDERNRLCLGRKLDWRKQEEKPLAVYLAQNGNDFHSFFLSTPAKRTMELFSKELLSCLFFKVNFEF